MIVDEIRSACAWVAEQAAHVGIEHEAIDAYARGFGVIPSADGADPDAHLIGGDREQRAAFWLTLDAINFGSGWFPTLRKRPGHSGYLTVAAGVKERFADHGGWSANALRAIDAREIAVTLGQDPAHELMELFAASLRDLGARVEIEQAGSFAGLVDAAHGSAVALAERLGAWPSFADASTYAGRRVPFLKRAQIIGADLHRAGAASFSDLRRLTMFADNLVPHVLRLDGILRFDASLVQRIEHGELLEHGSPEEVEIRACALHAVELIVAAEAGESGPRAADVDQMLWLRGQQPRYKAVPRHRSRCTAY
jgi:hypothetical protein